MKTALILSAALGLVTAPVLAARQDGQTSSGAHFMSASAAVDTNNGELDAAFNEAGLGNAGGSVHVLMAADATATYACINGGDNHPKANNKETVNGPVSAEDDFPITNNGRAGGTLSGGPPGAGGFSCPSGQSMVLACVSYSHVVLTDTTNHVSTTLAGPFRYSWMSIPGTCA